MDFRDFSNTTLKEEKEEFGSDSFEKKVEEETMKTMHKYSNYSQGELVDEFLHVAREQISKGELSHEKLDSIFSTLSPYLNDEQKNLFQDLAKRL